MYHLFIFKKSGGSYWRGSLVRRNMADKKSNKFSFCCIPLVSLTPENTSCGQGGGCKEKELGQ